MMDPLRHDQLLEEIQAAIRETGTYVVEADWIAKTEIEEVITFATSQYSPGQPLTSHVMRVSGSRWIVTIGDVYRPER